MNKSIFVIMALLSINSFAAQNETAKCYREAITLTNGQGNEFILCSGTHNSKARLDCYKQTMSKISHLKLDSAPEAVARGLCNSDDQKEQDRAYDCFLELHNNPPDKIYTDSFAANYICSAGQY